MMLKRAVLFALCLAMLICAFASCAKDVAQGSVEQETDASTESVEATIDPNYIEDLPERDFTGWEFKMYMRDSDFFIKDMYVDSYENATNFVEQALYNRNQEVSERFGGVDIMVGMGAAMVIAALKMVTFAVLFVCDMCGKKLINFGSDEN